MALEDCKLTYFAFGRGEAVRCALALGDVSFTDDRIDFFRQQEKWATLKPTTPWGSLPLLTLKDGTQISQQRAILRLVGKEATAASLYPWGGNDHVTVALVDSLMDVVDDIIIKILMIAPHLEQVAQTAARKVACEKGGEIYALLEKIDAFVAAHGQDGHAFGSTLTIVDLLLYCTLGSVMCGYFLVPTTTLDPFANIAAVRKTVRSHPTIANLYNNEFDGCMERPASFAPIVE